jgi:lon-related putative ATP-dependent protease
MENINKQAQEEEFLLQPTPMGVMTIPTHNGKPLKEDEFRALSQEERDKIIQKQKDLNAALEAGVRQARSLDKSAQEELKKLDRQVALFAINHITEELREKYKDLEDVLFYIDQVQDDILDNLEDFKAEPDENQPGPLAIQAINSRSSDKRKYRVNVLVDNSNSQGAPVILERNPTYTNLFGRVEQEAQLGMLTTDHTLIRQGSLHLANGGYLVLPFEDVLRNPLAWESLKRALENREITIEDAGERLGLFSTRSLRPEPIPLDVKVILIGTPNVYQLLLAYDEQFSELFKVKVDFDTQMPNTKENIDNYAAFISNTCKEENLKHLDATAMARIVEHGSRLVEDQEKLSTRFGEIADVIREASYYASLDNAASVTSAHVRKAIDEHYYRSSLIQERIQEMIARDVIKIDVSGVKTGQVNGLSVIELGDIAFGQPSRITVSVGLGREGLIDIEREAEMGGPIHTKGVMILSGYLTEKYAQDKPLSLAARLVFEQNYSGVDGDSASSTELYAILSALSDLPIKQSIAVTGSVNQKGEVQAIGGVNEKIEGYFEVCQAKGLTGEQGVMIPESNIPNLMLKESVIEAVREGKFHIWAIRTIDEGIERLTGVPAGQRNEDRNFEQDTVNDRVDARLKKLAETLSHFGEEDKKDKS